MLLHPSDLLQPGTVLLDTARPDAENGVSLLFREPVRVLTAAAVADVPGVLRALDAAVAEGRYVAGYLAYEAGHAFEAALLAPAAAGPLAWFGVYDAPAVLAPDAVDRLLDAVPGAGRVDGVRFEPEEEAYRAAVAAVRGHIREGNVYQVNYTGRVRFGFEGSPAALYRDLRRAQRVPYGALLYDGAAWVLSCSPELFFRRDGSRIVTRPMKGTVRRGETPAEDAALAAWLAADDKSRAENLMIVDLLRNDLSRCCRPGTVRVPHLFATERYETLTQMTSTVEGTLAAGCTYADLFRALFPCGSVTGAPKIRAMQVIGALEASPRGVYCGAIGYAAPGGRAVFSVAIRTVVLRGGAGEMGAGSGVVWDSDAGAEYREGLLKARFLTAAAPADGYSLVETMRWEDGVALLEGHVDRLRRSAACLGFPFDEAAFRAEVARAGAGFAPGTRHRVRVTLGAAGRLGCTSAPLPEGDVARPLRLALAPAPGAAGDPLRFHKTTRRAAYEAAFEAAVAQGYDEVVFYNDRGEVTEGSRTNVFARLGGRLVTPPVALGLLGGVYRRHLLDTLPGTAEAVLTVDDLAAAEAVFVCNAVHGLRAAQFEPAAVAFGAENR